MNKMLELWNVFLLECFVIALYLSVPATGNFVSSPTCYHEENPVCQEDGGECSMTPSMLNFGTCRSKASKLVLENDSSTTGRIEASWDLSYPSKDAFCYPYVNLTWTVPPDLMGRIHHFAIQLSYKYLGEDKVTRRLMEISREGSEINSPVTFVYDCHQIDHPGITYRSKIFALDDNLNIISSRSLILNTTCDIELKENNVREIPDAVSYRKNWRSKIRVLPVNSTIEIYFTMPICKKKDLDEIGFELLRIGGETNLTWYRLCQCEYKGSMKAENLMAGNYSISLLLKRSGRTTQTKSFLQYVDLRNGISVLTTTINNGQISSIKENTVSPNLGLSETSTNDSRIEGLVYKSWIVGGICGLVLFILSSTLILVFRRARSSSSQKLTVCLKGKWSSNIKGKKKQMCESSLGINQKHDNVVDWSNGFDSGIFSKHSDFPSLAQTSVLNQRSFSNTKDSTSRVCTCSDDCSECNSFLCNIQLKIHPPSDDGSSMDSAKFTERIKCFNAESDNF